MEECGQGSQPKCLQLYKDGLTIIRCGLKESAVGEKDKLQQQQMQNLMTCVEERIGIIEKASNKVSAPAIFPLCSLSKIDSSLAHTLLDEVIQGEIKISFSDIIGQVSAKEALRESVVLPSLRPDIFTGLRSPVQGILLFGPPGNGKTLLAQAAAKESGCRLFNISSSTLMSKWLGESEKLVRTLFMVARELQPCIIFMDEVDAMLSLRHSGEHESSRRLKTEFLSRFDGVSSNSNDRILVLGATNRPQDLDDAVIRRFPRRILVDMPSYSDRVEMMRHFLKDESHSLSLEDLEDVANVTGGFSASDIKALARHASLQCLRAIGLRELQHISMSEMRPIHVSDFMTSLEQIRPSVHKSTLSSLKKWMSKNR